VISLVNTNRSYLLTIPIAEGSPIVDIIVSFLLCGLCYRAVIASFWADERGRKPSIFAYLATTALGNLLMLVSGLNVKDGSSSSWNGGALACMLAGRVDMDLGVG
jgi:hypothetical protein